MWTSCAEDALNQVEAGDAEARPTWRTLRELRNAMHHPMNVDEFRVFGGDEEKYRLYQQAAGVLFLRFWLFFFFSWEKEPMSWRLGHKFFVIFCFFFSKNWSETSLLPQFSWGVETQSAFQCPRNFRSLRRILFGSSMSCFSGTVWNWCAWIWPSCSGFWWVPSLSWMSGISARRLDFIMGSEMGDLGRSVDHLKRTAKGWFDFFLFLTISWHMPGCQVHGISVLEQIEAAKCRPELYCIFGHFFCGWRVELLGTFEKGHLSIKKQISWLRYLTFFGGCQMLRSVNDFDWSKQLRYYWATEDAGGSLWVQGGAVCPWTWRIVRKPCRWQNSITHYILTAVFLWKESILNRTWY